MKLYFTCKELGRDVGAPFVPNSTKPIMAAKLKSATIPIPAEVIISLLSSIPFNEITVMTDKIRRAKLICPVHDPDGKSSFAQITRTVLVEMRLKARIPAEEAVAAVEPNSF
jgi:hypothetical protein